MSLGRQTAFLPVTLGIDSLQESPFPSYNKERPSDEAQLSMTSPALEELFQHLRGSIAHRLSSIPINGDLSRQARRVAILFSGGLDCSLIARIARDIFPKGQEVDLLNVAFENPRVVAAAERTQNLQNSTISAYELCPDRITGRASLEELTKLYSDRSWRFVSINIPYREFQAHKPQILNLLYPHNTEMDLSIGCALYFAARGRGLIQRPGSVTVEEYTTPSRVLISGLGADEIFGGYSRHARAFDLNGYAGLVEELELDFKRLGRRNLGRDDRVMSYWGKEVRYPFLDEDLLSWALSAPVKSKCNFKQNGIPSTDLPSGKTALRLLAWRLGIRYAASQQKRAIQFGARTAKMDSGKTKGHQSIPGT